MTRRLRIVVTGHVQGVGFRWFVRESAEQLRVSGWVHNNPDGSVELEAEGDRETLDSFEEVLRRGNPHVRVDSLKKTDVQPSGEKSFEIV